MALLMDLAMDGGQVSMGDEQGWKEWGRQKLKCEASRWSSVMPGCSRAQKWTVHFRDHPMRCLDGFESTYFSATLEPGAGHFLPLQLTTTRDPDHALGPTATTTMTVKALARITAGRVRQLS